MNTAPVTEHGKLLRDKFANLSVQHACVLLLGSLAALPVYAQDASAKPQHSPTRGDGPRSTAANTPAINTPPTLTQPASRPGSPPIIVRPPRGNTVIGNPSNNSSANNTTPSLPSPSTNPGVPPLGNSANITGPTPKSGGSDPKPVARGSGPSDASASLRASNTAQVPSINPPAITPPTSLSEVLPSAQQLSNSMHVIPAVAMPDSGKRTEPVEANNQSTQCVDVSLRPDPVRQSVSLVDFSGDGLIVSAVANSHVQSVFAQAGYAQMDVSQAGRWCLPQAAARALLLPTQGATTQAASLLVQTGNGLQLMSQDQWLAHQAAMRPLAAKTIAAQPRSAKKAVKKLAGKRSTKSFNNVAKNTSNLPPI
jgi:hypothetical protein